MRCRGFIPAVALLTAVVLAGMAPSVVAQVRRELRVGLAGVPVALDPAAALEGAGPLVARQVFDTLVQYRDSSTDVEPGLATHWSVSRDGLVWSFVLREGVRFHDGTPLTPSEVAQSFMRHLTTPGAEAPPAAPAWAALLRGMPGVLKEVRAAGPRTVQVVLSQPYAAILTVLAHPAFGVVRSVAASDGTARLVGTGQYRVVDATPGRLAVEAVAGHFAGATRTERIVFLDIATDDQAEAALDSASVDVWFPPGPPRRVDGAISTPGLRVGYLAFQTEKEPFSKKKVRQAVAAALDPAAIGLVCGRAAVPLQSFLPPGVWARREGAPVLGGTRDAVKRLLADGGWPSGFSATLLVPDEPTPLNLASLGETIQQALGSAGMPIQVRIEPTSAVAAARQTGQHDLVLAERLVAGGDPHLLLFPLSTSETATKGPAAVNFSFYRNPRLDDVLARASQLAFRPERLRLYQRSQATLAEELPWVPIYVRLLWALPRPEVRGLRLHVTGFHRLGPVSIEAPGVGIR